MLHTIYMKTSGFTWMALRTDSSSSSAFDYRLQVSVKTLIKIMEKMRHLSMSVETEFINLLYFSSLSIFLSFIRDKSYDEGRLCVRNIDKNYLKKGERLVTRHSKDYEFTYYCFNESNILINLQRTVMKVI